MIQKMCFMASRKSNFLKEKWGWSNDGPMSLSKSGVSPLCHAKVTLLIVDVMSFQTPRWLKQHFTVTDSFTLPFYVPYPQRVYDPRLQGLPVMQPPSQSQSFLQLRLRQHQPIQTPKVDCAATFITNPTITRIY